MQPGPLTVEGEDGGAWRTGLYCPYNGRYERIISSGWSEVAAALQLEAGQVVCLAARSPSRLLISRQMEPHFSAAAKQGPPTPLSPWPASIARWKRSEAHLPLAAGRAICCSDALRVPAVIVATDAPGAGEAGHDLSLPCMSRRMLFQ